MSTCFLQISLGCDDIEIGGKSKVQGGFKLPWGNFRRLSWDDYEVQSMRNTPLFTVAKPENQKLCQNGPEG